MPTKITRYQCPICFRPGKRKRDKNRAEIIECVGCGRTTFLADVEKQRPEISSALANLVLPRGGSGASGIITADDIRRELAEQARLRKGK